MSALYVNIFLGLFEKASFDFSTSVVLFRCVLLVLILRLFVFWFSRSSPPVLQNFSPILWIAADFNIVRYQLFIILSLLILLRAYFFIYVSFRALTFSN